jgi:hypothetical protein
MVSGLNGSLPLEVIGFLAGFVPPVVFALLRSWLSARWARRLRQRLGSPAAPGELPSLARSARGTLEVTLEGTFRRGDGPGGGVASFHRRGSARGDDASAVVWTDGADAPAWIEVGSDRVALTPPFHVLVGTRHDDGDADLVGTRRLTGSVRTVHPGDRVVVRGRLELETPEATPEGGYRAPLRGYRLVPEDGRGGVGGSIPIAAALAPRHPRQRGLGAWVGIGLLAGLAFGAVGGGVGRLRSRVPPACEATVEDMLKASRFEDALSIPCRAPHLEARAYVGLGRIPEASAAWWAARAEGRAVAPSVSEVQAHALAGHPDRAALVVEEEIRHWTPRSPRVEDLSCFGDAFALRAGDAGGRAAPECQAVLAGKDDGFRALSDAARSGTPGDFTCEGPSGLLYGGVASTRFDRLALEQSILRGVDRPAREALSIASKSDRIAYGERATELAIFFAGMGEREEARALLDLFDRIARAEPPGPSAGECGRATGPAWFHVVTDAAIAAEILGDDERVARYVAPSYYGATVENHWTLIRDGRADPYARRLMPGDIRLFGVASDGDGAALAKALDEQGIPTPTVFAEILPRIRARKEALHAWAVSRLPDLCLTCGIFTLAAQVGDRREIARLLGEQELEARFATLAHALVEILLQQPDPRELLAFERLHDLGTPASGKKCRGAWCP